MLTAGADRERSCACDRPCIDIESDRARMERLLGIECECDVVSEQ